MDLTALANQYGSDKGTLHREAHSYSIIYDLLFTPLRSRKIDFVEVGLQICSVPEENPISRAATDIPSIRMWRDFFESASLTGIDISDFSALRLDNFRFIQADCGIRKSIERAAASIGSADVIVDDASHASFHQQLTFTVLFPILRPGGLYIIEDLHWQPEDIEAQFPATVKTTELFSSLEANYAQSISAEVASMRDEICSVRFYDACALGSLRKFYNHQHNLAPYWSDVHVFLGNRARVRAAIAATKPVEVVPTPKLLVIEKAP